jgi:hypothetical protein
MSVAALLFWSDQASGGSSAAAREVVLASYVCRQVADPPSVTRELEFEGTFLVTDDPLSVERSFVPPTAVARGLCIAESDQVRELAGRLGCTVSPISNLDDDDADITERRWQAVCSNSRDRLVSVIARLSELVILDARDPDETRLRF